ncbi:MAG: glycosyltransferase N-terminal domain-containing protein [Pseudomonadota bacterium]|jgi:3-deoxy-D-manno-octulosonic-acid transferase
MRIAYYLITTVFYYVLYPYLYFRILKKKECPLRYQEKLGVSLKVRNDGYLMWFHCSSIGELKSIFPIIDHYLKKNQILVTTSTLGSNEVFQKKYHNTKNIIHQYAPIDSPQIIKKFFKKWKPNIIFFTESEIWPNQIFYAKNNNIPIILVNARISNKSFIKWKLIKNSMNKILNCFDLILCQSNESVDYFNYFGTNNIKILGNLKFVVSEDFENKEENLNLQKRLIFIALSTHSTEEEVCIRIHASLKSEYPNLLTIIIPRHINRIPEIQKLIINFNLNFLIAETIDNLENNTDILIINSYGNTKKILKSSKYVFIGGSLVKHGGQNPIEVAYNNALIFHGPHVHNFSEIYNLLNKENIAFQINSEEELIDQLKDKFNNYPNKNIKEKLIKMGDEILLSTIKKLDQYIVN